MNTDIRAHHPADPAPTEPGAVTTVPQRVPAAVAGVPGREAGRLPGPGAADWANPGPTPARPWAEVDSPTRPQWHQPEPPWVTSFAPPGLASGVDHAPWSPEPPSPTPGYGPVGSGGSPPPPPFGPYPPDWHQPPPRPGKTGRSGIALILVAVIVSAVIGLGIGSRLHRPAQALNSSLAPLTPLVPGNGGSASPTPTDPSSGGSGSSQATGSRPITSAQAAAAAAKVTPGVVDINTTLGLPAGPGRRHGHRAERPPARADQQPRDQRREAAGGRSTTARRTRRRSSATTGRTTSRSSSSRTPRPRPPPRSAPRPASPRATPSWPSATRAASAARPGGRRHRDSLGQSITVQRGRPREQLTG